MNSMEETLAAVEAAAAAAAGVPAKPRQEYTDEALESMTMTELVKVAQGKGLDTKKAKKKADVIALILEADAAQKAAEPAAADDLPQQSEGQTAAAADNQEEQPPTEHSDGPEAIGGHVLVVYTGMVNLRDMDGNVDNLAMQGQTFPVCGRLVKDGATWYKITDREKKPHLISAEVVRYME